MLVDKEMQQPESIVLLRQIAENTHTLSVKMFGSNDPNLENEAGRLPMVEAKAESAHRRIDRLQLRVAYFAGGVAMLAVLVRIFFK